MDPNVENVLSQLGIIVLPRKVNGSSLICVTYMEFENALPNPRPLPCLERLKGQCHLFVQ